MAAGTAKSRASRFLVQLPRTGAGIEYGSADGADTSTAEQWATDIDGNLQRLGDYVSQMTGEVKQPGDSRAFTLARHKDILQEYSQVGRLGGAPELDVWGAEPTPGPPLRVQEFKRLRASLNAAKERAELFGRGKPADHTAIEMGSNPSTALLLRERGMLASSSNAIEDVIGQAGAVSSTLGEQRRLFDSMNSKVLTVGSQFPLVNNILGRIRRKKNKDTIVLSAVVAACLIFVIFYVWRK